MNEKALTTSHAAAMPPTPNCIVIYVAGSCQKNPGPGGFGAILCRYIDGELKDNLPIKGGELDTTSNRLVMRAAVVAIGRLARSEHLPIYVISTNEYLVNGMNKSLSGWIDGGWKTPKGNKVENSDLWQEIVLKSLGLKVEFKFVPADLMDNLHKETKALASAERKTWGRRHSEKLFGTVA